MTETKIREVFVAISSLFFVVTNVLSQQQAYCILCDCIELGILV